MSWDFVAVGDVMLDGTLPEAVPGRRVHGRIALRPGGSAANAALAAAGSGARAAVVGRVGADPAGRLVHDALAEAGVDALLARDPEEPTGCVVVVGTAIVADRGASVRLAPEDLPPVLAAGSVLVSGYSLLQEPAGAAARAALARAQTQWLAVDVGSARLLEAYGADRFLEATAAAGVVLANAEEARALTGLEGEQAALELARRHRVACVKLGPEGAVAAAGGTVARASVRPIDPGDALGAGDAFAGAFLFALASGAEIEVAVVRGCAAAEELLRRANPGTG